MSAFLGPIHYWLYGKIELQEKIVVKVVALGDKKGLSELGETLAQKYGVFSTRPLEEIIDEGNIHGWLQDKVSRVEYKLAESVTEILKKDAGALEEIKGIFSESGAEAAQELLREEDLNLSGVFKGITDKLLDGMPCDHARALTKQEADAIEWSVMQCVHTTYWDEVGGDIEVFYALREAWLEGFSKALGLSFSKTAERSYMISRV